MRTKIAVAALAVIVSGSIPAAAHTPSDLETWKLEWVQEVAVAGLSVELLTEYRSMMDRHPIFLPAESRSTVQTRSRVLLPAVERWRPLVAVWWPETVIDEALAVMQCESRGDPAAKNPRSTASGLFQFLRGWWSGDWGYPAFDPFDPEANIRAGAWLYGQSGWSPWVCQP